MLSNFQVLLRSLARFFSSCLFSLIFFTSDVDAQSNGPDDWAYDGAIFGGVFDDAEVLEFASQFFQIASAIREDAVVPDDAPLGYIALGRNVFSGSALSKEFAPPATTAAGRMNLANLNLDKLVCNIRQLEFSNGRVGTIIAADIDGVGRSGLKQCLLFGVSIAAGMKNSANPNLPNDMQALSLLTRLIKND